MSVAMLPVERFQDLIDGPGELGAGDDNKIPMWSNAHSRLVMVPMPEPKAQRITVSGGGGGGTSTIAGATDFTDTTGSDTDGYAIIWDNDAGEFTLGTFEAAGTAAAAIVTHVGEADPHTQYLLETDYSNTIVDSTDFTDTTGSGTDGYAIIWDDGAAAFTLGTFETAGAVSTHAGLTSGTHGVSGDIVGTTDSQTLSGKTLTTPTIASFTNATHDHSNAAGGGTIAHSDLTGLTSGDPHTQYLLADGSRTGASSGAQTFTNGVITGIVRPSSDSTTAVRVQNAAGTSDVITVDTTNKRIGINATPIVPLYVNGTAGNGYQMRVDGAGVTSGIYMATGFASWGTINSSDWRFFVDNNSARGVTIKSGTGYFGVGQTGVLTAYCDLAASTTSAASLRIRSGTVPTSPNDGDVWKLSDSFVMHATDATTSSVVNTLRLRRGSSGTSAAGFGSAINFQLKSSTTAGQDAGRLSWEWVTATHASRASRGTLTAYSTSTEQEAIAWDGDSGGVKLGFYGTTPVAQSAAYTVTNGTTDRSYDANSTTLDEVADVLGTLISDLQAVGLIG